MRRFLLLIAILYPACAQERPARDAESASVQSGSHPSGGGEPASEPSETAAFHALEVPGFLPAVVFAPSSPGPHPLIVAAHGAGGVPEWECDYWRRLSRERAFLLCLRGERTSNAAPSGYYYRTHLTLRSEFRAAVTAFRERFTDTPNSAALYAGFSQGAIMGAPMIVEYGSEFPYLALIEGGYEYWSQATAQKFARTGGKRVLFVCGTQGCANKAEIPAAFLREANVEVRIEHAPGAGHTPAGEVMTRTNNALPWLTAGAEVWD